MHISRIIKLTNLQFSNDLFYIIPRSLLLKYHYRKATPRKEKILTKYERNEMLSQNSPKELSIHVHGLVHRDQRV